MKQTLFLLFTVIVIVWTCEEPVKLNKFTNDAANFLLLRKEEVDVCVNKTSFTFDDLEHVDRQVKNNSLTMDLDDKSLKVGCFFGCLAENKGLIPVTNNTNVDNVREKLKEILQLNKVYSSKKLPMYYKVVDTCVDQVRNETDDCKISFKFVMCYINEM